ncbi:MAG: hypothetical protein U0002_20940 [Thermoanaerobaculia bacterium]
MNGSLKILRRAALAAASLAWLGAVSAGAVGIQDITDVTALEPSPVPGEVISPVVPMRWDDRCQPFLLRINDTLDPIPNPLGAPVLSVAEVMSAFRQAAAAWSAIPTSFFEVRVAGTYSNPGFRRFDQVNEATFRSFDNAFLLQQNQIFSRDQPLRPIAIARPTRLLADAEFTDGLDLDGDGDVDVVGSLESCQDVDGDGDVEFPPGLYRAGTILDVDIVLNTSALEGNQLPGYRFTVGDAALDNEVASVDLLAVAVQSLGLAQSLTHAATAQRSDRDGAAATLFPFLDTTDPVAERQGRRIDVDAAASSSKLYPEGSAASGPAALQAGDIRFEARYGRIRGEIFHGELGQPLVGGLVIARDARTGAVVAETVSGTSRRSVTPDGFFTTFLDAAFHILDGRYELALPPGLYTLEVRAADGLPVRQNNFNLQTLLAPVLNQNHFHTDFWSGPADSALELFPAFRGVVAVRAGEIVSGIDITTNRTVDLASFGSFDTLGFADAEPGSYFAVRIPRQQFLDADAALGGQAVVHAAEFLTGVADGSAVPLFRQALLTTGRTLPDGSARLDLEHPLLSERGFAGADLDFAPLWAENPRELATRLRRELEHGQDDLYLVLQLPQGPFPGPSGTPPQIGLDGGPGNDVPIAGNSFVSHDGRRFLPDPDHNFLFQLVLGPGRE